MTTVVATFYHFAPLTGRAQLQREWKAFMMAHNVTGTILVTPEGLNATIAGPRQGIDETLALLRSHPGFESMPHKESFAQINPFQRTKVKLKPETIPLGVPVNPARTGTYIEPKNWNALINQPGVALIDTRNDYEVKLGQFEGAINPATQTFKQLPQWLNENLPDKSQPIAMYCTGGIRCEKSTAYLKEQGYENVYHLQGGILKYLEEVPEAESRWQGDCYVFDDRVAVTHALAPATHLQNCPHCKSPINAADFKRLAANNHCSNC